MSTRYIAAAAVAIALGLATLAAHAADSNASAPGKTRAEVIAEMQAVRAAGQLNKPDYYPVYERSWQEIRQSRQADAAK